MPLYFIAALRTEFCTERNRAAASGTLIPAGSPRCTTVRLQLHTAGYAPLCSLRVIASAYGTRIVRITAMRAKSGII